MTGSTLARQIDEEYRVEQAYKKKPRQDCKMKPCERCKYNSVCTEVEE